MINIWRSSKLTNDASVAQSVSAALHENLNSDQIPRIWYQRDEEKPQSIASEAEAHAVNVSELLDDFTGDEKEQNFSENAFGGYRHALDEFDVIFHAGLLCQLLEIPKHVINDERVEHSGDCSES